MIIYPHLTKTARGIEPEKFYAGNSDTIWKIDEVLSTHSEKTEIDELHIIVNFNFCKLKFIEYLFNSAAWHYKNNDSDNIFSFDIRDKFITLFYTSKKKLILTDFEIKFAQPFTDWKTAAELEAADYWHRATCSLDAKTQFYQTIKENPAHGRNIIKLRFPEAHGKELEYLSNAKTNTIQYSFCIPGEYKNIYSYDIKQSYPARVYNKFFPAGIGHHFERSEPIPSRYWYIRRVRVNSLNLKTQFDFLDLKPQKIPGYFFLTKESIEMLPLYYSGSWQLLDGFFYKMRRGTFEKFFDMNFYDENNFLPHIKKYNKFRNNLLLGTFAQKDKASIKYTFSNGKLLSEPLPGKSPYKYLPLYLYVVGAARRHLARLLYENRNRVIYANTDGFFTTREIPIIQTSAENQPGSLELRAVYNRIAIKGLIDYYAEEITADGEVKTSIKLVGRRALDEPNYKDYVNGNFKSYGIGITAEQALTFVEYKESPLKP